MKPSEKCKQAGLKSLEEMSDLTFVSTQTLRNWHKSRPVAFETILYGAVVKKLFEITNKGYCSDKS